MSGLPMEALLAKGEQRAQEREATDRSSSPQASGRSPPSSPAGRTSRNRQRRRLLRYFRASVGGEDEKACKYCAAVVDSESTRALVAHLHECERAPPEVKQAVRAIPASPEPSVSGAAREGRVAATSNEVLQSALENRQWQRDVVQLFSRNNLPLSLADSPQFRAFFERWTPGRTLPTPTELLRPVCSDLRAVAMEELISLDAVVIVLETSALKDSGVITVLVTAACRQKPPLFWYACRPEDLSPDMTEALERVMTKALYLLRSRPIAAVITTGGAELDADWEALCSRFSLVYAGPTIASQTEGLLQQVLDAVPVATSLRKDAVSVLKYIDDKREMQQQFIRVQAWFHPDRQDRRPLLSPDTSRPRQLYTALKSLYHNKSVLKQLFTVSELAGRSNTTGTHESDPREAVTVIVHTKTFWKNIKLIVALLEPIIDMLDTLETPNCPLSEAVRRWRALLKLDMFRVHAQESGGGDSEVLSRVAATQVIRAWGSRFEQSVFTAAFVLDPSNTDDRVSYEDADQLMLDTMSLAVSTKVCDRFRIHSRTFYSVVNDFVTAQRYFDGRRRQRSTEQQKPWTWWRIHGDRYQYVSHLARALFSIPTSVQQQECKSASTAFVSISDAKHSTHTPSQILQLAFREINGRRLVLS